MDTLIPNPDTGAPLASGQTASPGGWSNQTASDSWVPTTDKFGNAVNPVGAQGGTLSPTDAAKYKSMIRDLANRTVQGNLGERSLQSFQGYTLPDNPYVRQALSEDSSWLPSQVAQSDFTTGKVTGYTPVDQTKAFSILGLSTPPTVDQKVSALQVTGQEPAQPSNVPIGQTTPGFGKSNYAGPSIVDYLKSVSQDSSFASRAKLAQQYGIKNYAGTAQQNTQLLGILRGVPANNPPGGLTPDSLKNANNISVPGATGTSSNADSGSSLVAGGNTNIQNIITQLTPAQTPAEQKQQSILDQMATLTGQDAQKAADQLTQEQSAGLPALKQEFAAINAQILTRTAEYNALTADQEGKPVTMDTIIGATAQIQRVKASEIGMLTAQSQALQGQITTAQDTVNRAIDLKYSTIEAQMNVYQAQLNALQPELNKEEKVAANAQQLILDEKKQEIADTKQRETQIQGVMLDAIKAGLTDSKVISQISAAKTYAQAAQLAAPYIGAKSVKPLNRMVNKVLETSTDGGLTWHRATVNGGSASGGGSGGGKGFNVKTATSEMEREISNQTGDQGYISKETWSEALKQWTNAGGTRKAFISGFNHYANPGAGYDYEGIKPINKPAKSSNSATP